MMCAAHNGHLKVVMQLAELGVDLSAADNVGNVIFVLNKEHSSDFLMLFYACFSHQDGSTALMLAAEQGHIEVVTQLAELGVDLSAVDYVSTAIFMLTDKHFYLLSPS